MGNTAIRIHDRRVFPHCDRCNKPVNDVSWENYFDEVQDGSLAIKYLPNGCGHIDVACHGEVWRVKFYPWGFGKPEIRREGDRDEG